MFILGFHIDKRPRYQTWDSLQNDFYRRDELYWAVVAERNYYQELLSNEKVQSWEHRNDDKKKKEKR